MAQTGVAGYGYFSYFNGFQIDTDWCSYHDDDRGPVPIVDDRVRLSGREHPRPQPIPRRMDRRGTSSRQAALEPPSPAGGPVGVGDGWYSYNLGTWHIISLNIEC